MCLRLMSDTEPQIQEAWRPPTMLNAQKATPRSIILKLKNIEDKEKILNEARDKIK